MQTVFKEPLFDSGGRLRAGRLTGDAREVMQRLRGRLGTLDRRLFLPLDLAVVLLERGHRHLAEVIARGTEGVVESTDVDQRLQVLAEEIDDDDFDATAGETAPELSRANFSRGLTRILREAFEQARGRGDERIDEDDLVRCVLWRAEAVESASIRWAIRRLREGKGDSLFDADGLVRFELFDSACTGFVQGAMKLAATHGTSFLGTPHLIAMMASVRDSVIWRSARARGLEPSRLREELLRLIGAESDPLPEFNVGRKTLTPRMIRMLQQTLRDAEDETVRETQLVEAFLADGGSSLELLRALGLESEIRNALGEPRVLTGSGRVQAAIDFASERRTSPTLEMLGRDLTEEALEGRLPAIVGRQRELTRVFNVLMRHEQRNPLLIGEAGVGKTALAVGLAQKIAAGRGPERLRGHRVIEINGASLMSGTSYRGDLEARIESLLEEASRRVILFIDEAHAVFSPRSGSNTPAEVPNHFKRALASGKIAVVAATTEDEYRRWFERDPALKRRFESVEIEEPSRSLTGQILEALVPRLEEEYQVRVCPEAIDSAIDLSVRYLPEQRLPDKAKKLLMDACITRANPLADPSPSSTHDQPEPDDSPADVGHRAVAHQVHLKTSIPMERLLGGEMAWWEGLEQRLCAAIAGQNEAMSQIAHTLVASRIKHADRQRPLAVLAFVGPPGVGKATAAEALAEEVFSDRRAMVRLDMTDFQQAHSLSRLIGSPPGYVGYEDADMLVTPLRKRPASVVLLEDFDRAHPDVRDRLLRLIEEGQLTDTRGRVAEAANAVFVLTICADRNEGGRPIGFEARDSGDVRLKQCLRDQQLACRLEHRVDDVVLFSDLSNRDSQGAIALCEAMVERFIDNTRDEYGVELQLGEELHERLYAAVQGLTRAREVEHQVERLLVDPVCQQLLCEGRPEAMKVCWDDELGEVCPEPADGPL